MTETTNQYAASEGLLFFNFGRAYLLRMAICILSLREHYQGPICIVLFEGDPDSDAIKQAMSGYDVKILLFKTSEEEIKNFTYSTFKHKILAQSPFERSLLCDTDLLFLASPKPLLDLLATNDLVVTNKCNKPRSVFMTQSKFIEHFTEALGPEKAEEISAGLISNEYVNIGILGVRNPKESLFLKDWSDAMMKFKHDNPKCKEAIDEYYISAIYHKFRHSKVGPEWNFVDNPTKIPTNTKVLHYIRDLHRGTMDPKGVVWQEALDRHSGNPFVKAWAAFDPAVENPEKLRIRKLANLSPYRASLINNTNFSIREPLLNRCVFRIQLSKLPRSVFNMIKIVENLGWKSFLIFFMNGIKRRINPNLKHEL